MNEERKISTEMQNAFIDGELDAADWACIAERMGQDARLREELCALRAAKELVQHAYAVPPAVQRRSGRGTGGIRRWTAAASVALAAGAGWFGHAWWNAPAVLDPASAYMLRDAQALGRDRILVHVSSGDRASLGRTLDEVEDLLRAARIEKRSIKVEIVANRGGVDLLRARVSPFADRLAALRAEYANVQLVACGQTVRKLRERGATVDLLPGTEVAPSALDEIVRRLRDGWVYVRA